MVSGLPIQRQSLLACKKERGHRCLKTLLQIWRIMPKLVKYQSLTGGVAGDRLDICDLHRHYSTPFEINLKVIKVTWKMNFHWNLCDFAFFFLLISFFYLCACLPCVPEKKRLRPTGQRLYTSVLKSWTVVFNKCSSFWCGFLGGTIEAESTLYWRSCNFGRTVKSVSGKQHLLILQSRRFCWLWKLLYC